MTKPTFNVNEGGLAHEHSMDHALEFFSKAGSLFVKHGTFYGGESEALDLFKPAWYADPETAFKLLLWVRDCRGGAGNRSGGRSCLHWVATQFPDWVLANLHWLPIVGRWDDLRALFGTPAEKDAASFWWHALGNEKHVLAAKWADRSDKPVFEISGLKEIGKFRRLIASIRSAHIVEAKMCAGLWNEINYEHVPSKAMSLLTNAFKKHDVERFEAYKAALVKGDAKVHASVLFPHDCVRTSFNGDTTIADQQFAAMPNFMVDSGEIALAIVDTSGSMDAAVAGNDSSVRRVHVSTGLGLYFSDRVGKDHPFWRKFVGFSNEGRFVDWTNKSFSEALRDKKVFDGAVGHTRIDRALDMVLDAAKFFKLPKEKMFTSLVIISDMQFASDSGKVPGQWMGSGWYATNVSQEKSLTEVQRAIKRWTDAGYNAPKIIYWNVAGYAGNVDTRFAKNVAMVSGFSPAILRNIFNGEDLTPLGVMRAALKKYEINVPK